MEHTSSDLHKSHHRLIYTAISESLAMFMIAFWQIWYIKNILESRTIIGINIGFDYNMLKRYYRKYNVDTTM